MDIPDDAMKAARRQCDLCGITPHSDMRIHAEHVAAFAILGERRRCAAVARRLIEEPGDEEEPGDDDWLQRTAANARAERIASLIEAGQ